MICRTRSQRITTLITIPEEAPVGFRDATISNDNSSSTCHVESNGNWLLEQVSFLNLKNSWGRRILCVIQALNNAIAPFLCLPFSCLL
jgi:hypothetical protein